jgi:hypothetical protein
MKMKWCRNEMEMAIHGPEGVFARTWSTGAIALMAGVPGLNVVRMTNQ